MRPDKLLSRVTMMLPAGGVRAGGRVQSALFTASGGRLFNKYARKPVLQLTTTGRRSGQPRETLVLYLVEGQDLVVIGSNAGNEGTPAWALNLLADPEAEVRLRGGRRRVRARRAEGGEEAALWEKAKRFYLGFDDYRARTDRVMHVFVLEPRP